MTTKTRMAFVAAWCGAVLLAGCSSDAADSTEKATDAAQDQSAQAQEAPSGDMQRMGGGGLTGEIAYVSDGLAQVQDGSTQTAVSFTDATTVTQEVEIALADVEVGSCIVATLGDDDAATAVTVSEPDEVGECTTGFGGGMGGMGGEMPSDMPTAMPEGMELPEGAELPEGMEPPADGELPGGGGDMPGGGGFAQIAAGQVTAVAEGTLTVDGFDGEETTVTVADDATVTGSEEADEAAIVEGMCLTATGEADDAGGYDAETIRVFSPGDDGCVTMTGFGGRGGMGGAPGGDETSVGEPALESEG